MTSQNITELGLALSEEGADALIKELSKISAEAQLGLVQMRAEQWFSLPSLPEGLAWRLCDGSPLYPETSPRAYAILGSALPNLTAGTALIQKGNLGYKEALSGGTGRGAVLNMHGQTNASKNQYGFIRDYSDSNVAGYATGAFYKVEPALSYGIDTTSGNDHTYGKNLTFSAANIPFAGSSENNSSELSAYKDNIAGVIPASVGVSFFVVIDEIEGESL